MIYYGGKGSRAENEQQQIVMDDKNSENILILVALSNYDRLPLVANYRCNDDVAFSSVFSW